jgi:chromosome segregation ATPase
MAVRHSSQHDPEQEPIWQTGQHMLKLARQLACLQKQLDGQPKHLPTLKKRDEALQQWEAHHRPLLFMAPQYAESAQTLREAIEEREQEAAQLRQELNQLSAVIPTVSPLLPESVQKQRLQGRTLEEAQMAFLESARAYQETQANLAYYQELQRTFLAVPKLSQEIEGTYRPEALYHPLSEETRALLSAYEHCLAEFDEQALKTKGFIYFPDCAQFRRAQRQRHP